MAADFENFHAGVCRKDQSISECDGSGRRTKQPIGGEASG